MSNYLGAQRRCFAMIGIDMQPQRGNTNVLLQPLRYILWTGVTFLIVLLMGCYICISEQDKAVMVLTVFLQGALSVLKSCMFLARNERFRALIVNLERLAVEVNDELERTLWHEQNRLQRIIVSIYYVCCTATGTLYCAGPAIILLVTQIKGHGVRSLPFEACFPYNAEQFSYYTLSYLWCISFIVYAIHAIVAMDGLFCWFIFNISAHFHMLQRKVIANANNLCENQFVRFQQQMSEVFRYHQRIIDLTTEFGELFAPIVFIEIAVSYLKLCFSAYQLFHLRELSMLPVIAVGLGTIVIQLLIYCLSGEKIKNASSDLAQCIYLFFPWERMSSRMKRLQLLPLMRAQREINLTGYLFVVDHRLLVWIFKTTGSIIGFLSATRK